MKNKDKLNLIVFLGIFVFLTSSWKEAAADLYECETQTMTTSGQHAAEDVVYANASDGYYERMLSTAVEEWMQFDLDVETAGTYNVKVKVFKSPDKGICRLSINGENVGSPLDLYQPSVYSFVLVDIGTTYLNAGTNTFRFTVTGKNEASNGYILTFDYIDITTIPILEGTTAVSSLASITATSGGNVTSDGGASVTARGVCWSTAENPTTADSKTTESGGTGTFTSSITGLTANTLYYVRAYATNSLGTAYGDQVSFTTTSALPTLAATTTVSDIIYTTAASGGNVTSDGGANVTARGVCWSTTENPTTADSKTTDGTGTGTFTSAITGLTANTLYYVRAYATNSVGTAYGDQVSFTISSLSIRYECENQATTTSGAHAAEDVEYAAASGGYYERMSSSSIEEWMQFGLNVETAGNCNVKVMAFKSPDKGICQLAINGEPVGSPLDLYQASGYTFVLMDIGTTYLNAGTNTFRFTVTGKNASSTYYRLTFDYIDITTTPTLEDTTEVFSITSTAATSSGNVISDGGASITVRGACWSTTENPTTANSKTTDGTGTGIFTSSITGLTAGTLYYVRAYATNSLGTAYGNQMSFTTLALPTLAATTAVSNIASTTATSGGNVISDGGAGVTARGVCWSTTENPTMADFITTNGIKTGTFTSSITGLTANTLYYVRAYATNSVGTAYGDQVSFTTTLALPTIEDTTAVSSITTTTATSGGNITSDGGASVTARGVCWSTTENPTTADFKTTDGTGTGTFTSTITDLTANTLYYLRAYATNSVGTAYGNQVSFTAGSVSILYECETQTTTTSGQHVAEDVVYATASGSYYERMLSTAAGEWMQFGLYVETAGNCNVKVKVFKSPDKGICQLAINDENVGSLLDLYQASGYTFVLVDIGTVYLNAGTNTFKFTVTGKTPASTNYRLTFDYIDITTIPTLEATTAVSSITTTTATSGGNVTSDGGASITARGICWSTSPNPTTTDSITTESGGAGIFTSSIIGLRDNTLYYVRAYATNSLGTAYGDQVSFSTPALPTLAATTAASNIATSTATSGGNVTSDGGDSVTARGVCWSTMENPINTNNKTTDGTGTGTFTSAITGLTAGTLYYVRAYAANSVGTAYGDQVSFTTPTLPTLEATTAVSGITSTTSTSGGDVTSDGGASITARGVCWGTSPNPTTADSKTTDGTGIGTYTSTINGLSTGIRYYVRAYSTNSVGTAYGDQVSFTAGSVPVHYECETQTTTTSGQHAAEDVEYATASGVYYERMSSSTTGEWIQFDLDVETAGTYNVKVMVFKSSDKGICQLTVNGDALGSPLDLYQASGYTFVLEDIGTTSLNAGTNTLRFTVTDKNASSTYYRLTFDYIDITTIPTLDSTTAVYSITSTTATSGGNVINDGGTSVTARGVCWSTSPNPTIVNCRTTESGGAGLFVSSITGLTGGTRYYVRAYATNSVGTAYGDQVSFTTPEAGSIYHFSVSGNDANDGLSPDSPKKTLIAAANLMAAGKTILFKRGDAWYHVNYQWDLSNKIGTSGSPILIDTYGTGSKPIIADMELFAGTQGWTEDPVGSHKWKHAITGYSDAVCCYVDGISMVKVTLASLNANTQFAIDAGYVYVYSTSAPTFVEVTPRDNKSILVAANISYITIKNIDFRGGGNSHSILINAPSNHFTLDSCILKEFKSYGPRFLGSIIPSQFHNAPQVLNCYINKVWSTTQNITTAAPGGDGIGLEDAIEGALIRGNTVIDIGHEGIRLNGGRSSDNYGCKNCLVELNQVYLVNCSYMHAFSVMGLDGKACYNTFRHNYFHDYTTTCHVMGDHNKVYSNVFANVWMTPISNKQSWAMDMSPFETTDGVAIWVCHDNMIVNNTIYDCKESPIYVHQFSPAVLGTNNVIKNNLIVKWNDTDHSGNPNYGIFIGTPVTNLPICDNNGFWKSSTSEKVVKKNGTGTYTAVEFNALSYADNNLQQDPLFVDEANRNFRLSSSSPYISGGQVLSGMGSGFVDFDGVDWDPTSPSIGAFQYVGGLKQGITSTSPVEISKPIEPIVKIKIYPNPSSYFISVAGIEGNSDILNIYGINVWHGYISKGIRIDVSHFISGVYFVKQGNSIGKFMVLR